jgi:arylsulfatase A-like enzyme
VGQKLNEHQTDVGGYLDSLGTPAAHLLGEIKFVDGAIGRMVDALTKRNLLESTMIIISAKHGQSPIDPKRLLRITADNPSDVAPSDLLSPGGVGPGKTIVQVIEDDISLMWLGDQQQTEGLVDQLEANESLIGGGEIFSGAALRLMFGDPLKDSRTPDLIVAPNVGTVYTGKKKKIAEHGGFAHDDTNVMLLVSNPGLRARRVVSPVETAQIAPTILEILDLDAGQLMAVRAEGTTALPGIGR